MKILLISRNNVFQPLPTGPFTRPSPVIVKADLFWSVVGASGSKIPCGKDRDSSFAKYTRNARRMETETRKPVSRIVGEFLVVVTMLVYVTNGKLVFTKQIWQNANIVQKASTNIFRNNYQSPRTQEIKRFLRLVY